MTEPVARAVSPRRTVRVAVALVAGQAALCAVIGWVTFGPSEAKPNAASALPLTKPSLNLTLPKLPGEAPPASPAASKETSSPRAARSSRPATTRATSKPPADQPRPVMAPGLAPPVSPSPNPDLVATPAPPSPPEAVQPGVVEGRPCDPDGAKGLTTELVELHCAKDADGDLVWQIN